MKNFCVLPFIHIEVDTDGKIRPCCVYDGHYLKEDGSEYNARIDSIESFRNSAWIKNMQKTMLDDLPDSGCHKCYSEEKNNNTSRRMKENERFSAEIGNIRNGVFNLKILDIKPGNTCNLKCRICNEFSSSKWIDDKKKLFNTDKVFDARQLANFKWYNNQSFWEELDTMMQHVEYIEIFGGEPMLIKQQFQFLERLVANGLSKNITVAYATNGTIFPEHAVQNIWPMFKNVVIMLSADGIGKGFEYSRYPAKWEQYEQTLDSYLNAGIVPTISYGVSVYSIFNLLESIEYYYSKNVPVWLNIVYDSNTTITALPAEVKQKITNDIKDNFKPEWKNILQEKTIEGVVNYMNSTTNNFDTVLNDIHTIDKIRQQNFNNVFDDLRSYING